MVGLFPVGAKALGKEGLGTKTFRCLNAWFSHPEFRDFVTGKWNSYSIEGWDGFVIKETFKRLKEDLKLWNSNVFGNVDRRIENHRREIWKLDTIHDIMGLND
ncbi:hypothetical protein ACS0TY_007224 [Phlomoides rotata]